MTLSTSAIVGIKFGKTLGGYNPKQVDDFLNEVIQGLEKLTKENNTLKKQNITLAESNLSVKSKNSILIESNASLVREVEEYKNSLKKYKGIENMAQYSLFSIREMNDEIQQGAAQKAEIIINEAKLLSNEIVKKAQMEKAHMLEQLEQAKQDLLG